LGASFFARSYHGEPGSPGVVDRQHVVVTGQVFGDALRVGDVALDPQAEGLQALGDQERV